MINIAQCQLNTKFGQFEFSCFNWGEHEDQNILCLKNANIKTIPFVRIQSACFTAEIFRSLDCDCHEQLANSLELISEQGGIFIYLLRDGRGAGIYSKVQGMRLTQEEGIDTASAYEKLGIKPDPRNYENAVKVINHFGYKEVNLLTNNPRKIYALEKSGITVHRLSLEIEPTPHSCSYLKSKKERLGHMLSKYFT